MIRQIVEAGILAAFGFWSIWDGYRITTSLRADSSFDALGPDRYIVVLGAILVVLSALRFRGACVKAAAGVDATETSTHDALDARRLTQLALAFAGYVFLAPFGGYVVTTAAFFFAVYCIMDVRGWIARVLAAAVTAAAFFVVFIKLANIPLPLGKLGLPF